VCLLTQLQACFAEIIYREVRFATARSEAVHQDLNEKVFNNSQRKSCHSTLHSVSVINVYLYTPLLASNW
jgi:hypothetical protein